MHFAWLSHRHVRNKSEVSVNSMGSVDSSCVADTLVSRAANAAANIDIEGWKQDDRSSAASAVCGSSGNFRRCGALVLRADVGL